MNCEQANRISMRDILESFSLFPSKENSRTAFYYAIDRDERTPSLHVDFVKNTAFDFGTGKKYDQVSLTQLIKKCSVSDALEYLKKFDFSLQKQPVCSRKEKEYSISTVEEVNHPALIRYLKTRKVFNQKGLVKEIRYRMGEMEYFGIGFENNSGGFEIRNKYAKLCLGKKDITLIKNASKTLRIFEGFFDFLSFKSIEKTLQKEPGDFTILNSLSLAFKLKIYLKNYNHIELYLDNDEAGNKATKKIKEWQSNISDERILYRRCKDLNEFLMRAKRY